MRVVGAVLTGGASRRMGRTKALIEIDQVPMARRVADALTGGGCTEVVLIGGSPTELATIGRTVIPDLHPGDGPLGGVLTALAWSRSRSTSPVDDGFHDGLDDGDHDARRPTHVVVAACDLALLDAESVTSLLAVAGRSSGGRERDVVVAQSDRRQPALAVWNVDVAERLAVMFDDGVRSLNTALDALDCAVCVVAATAVTNMNRPDDLPPRDTSPRHLPSRHPPEG